MNNKDRFNFDTFVNTVGGSLKGEKSETSGVCTSRSLIFDEQKSF